VYNELMCSLSCGWSLRSLVLLSFCAMLNDTCSFGLIEVFPFPRWLYIVLEYEKCEPVY
jgi:hypothetical protein